MEGEARIHLAPGVPFETNDFYNALVVSSRNTKVKIYCDSAIVKEVDAWEPTVLPQYSHLSLVSQSEVNLILAVGLSFEENVSLPTKESWCSIS